MNYYKRKLPHWQPEGAQYFITIRLKSSLPRAAIRKLKIFQKQLYEENLNKEKKLNTYIQRKIFKTYEDILDKGTTGPKWLGKKEIAKLVERSICYRDSKIYDLYAYCIMPNHIHLVFRHIIKTKGKETPVTYIMRDLKRYTGRKCNELENTIRYTLQNPVKADLVNHWQKWPYSYCKPEFVETFV
ncbi:MAG TPA: transposase [Balneolaceae bacterium]|nr:transposase [Balneolaceae bacterium]